MKVVEIMTVSGEYFDFANPENSKFTIRDIAHALSHICRYTGHVQKFYSVAQHSYLVSKCVPKELALQGLLHDAHEAFVGDVNGPLKSLIPDYRSYEDIAAAEVRKRFGIPFDLDPSINEVDMRMLMTERRDLLPERDDDHEHWPQYEPYPERIQAANPTISYALFIGRFKQLTEK